MFDDIKTDFFVLLEPTSIVSHRRHFSLQRKTVPIDSRGQKSRELRWGMRLSHLNGSLLSKTERKHHCYFFIIRRRQILDINFANATGTYFHIKEDVYCMFSQYNNVYCYDQSMDVSIVRLYSGATQCYSYANQKGEDLCQNLAKSKDFQTGCGNSCHIYEIN